ncbi:MAG: hypothetical protein ABIR94_13845 [Rubrivivax sp.]
MRSLASLDEPLARPRCVARDLHRNCRPANAQRTPATDAGIVSGADLKGWRAVSAAAFAGCTTLNRHRPRD